MVLSSSMGPTWHLRSAPADRNRPADESAILEGRDISVAYEGVQALAKVDLSLHEREIMGLIGPNGAGKTTLLNVLSGAQRPTSGIVRVAGTQATTWRPQWFAKMGVARTFQNLRLFSQLSLFENVEVGAVGAGVPRREARRRANELLDTMELRHKASSRAGSLSYGEEKLLALARALAAYPRILLLDEPAAGLSEAETDWMMGIIGQIRDRLGCGVLVVEHDMRLIMGLCERIHVLDHGKTISSGRPTEVQADQLVLEAYLGARDETIHARS
jgi:ABC-type branched-subunit amino acid transport system ATPase component